MQNHCQTSCGLNLYIQSTNSIYASVSSTGTVTAASGSVNAFYNDGNYTFGSSPIQIPINSPPFQTAGAGKYYLASDTLRGQGTTAGVSSSLLTDLKTKTTHPPIVLPALTQVSGNLTFFPQVQRYTSGAPDLGYYSISH